MRTLLLSLMLICAATLNAQTYSDNYTRGFEALEKGDFTEAVRYFDSEVRANPADAYAHICLGHAKCKAHDPQGAIEAYNLAIAKLTADNTGLISLAYEGRGEAYYDQKNLDAAAADISQAIMFTQDPDAVSRLYYFRALIYNSQQKFDQAEDDFRKLVELKKRAQDGYIGLGSVAVNKSRHAEALGYFNQAIAIAPDYSYAYDGRAMCYAGMEKYPQAAADLVKAIDLNHDNRDALTNIASLATVAYSDVIAALKTKQSAQPQEIIWPYIIGGVATDAHDHRQSIAAGKTIIALEGAVPGILNSIVQDYAALGLYDKAIEYCDKYMAATGDKGILAQKSQLEDYAGRSADAMRDINECIRLFPDLGQAYYWRGWMKEHANDYDGALSDYTLAINKDPNDAYSYMCRGRLYQLRGEAKKAEVDLREAIRLDSDPAEWATCAPFAYLYLGQKAKAIEIMNAILKTEDMGNFYDAACLYSEIGDKTMSLAYLRKSLEAGFRRFSHMEHDHSLDNIRTTAE